MSLHQALQAFAAAVTAKTGLLPGGGPEEQLRGPFENFIAAAGAALGRELICAGETALPDRLGRPDFAIHEQGALTGYAELKAPGLGADASRFRGRDRAQFKRFSAIPNLLYSDGSYWALYRNGQRVGKIVRLSGDAAQDGAAALGEEDARAIEGLLRDFLAWTPILPLDRTGRVDLKAFAELVAPLCRMLRDDVADALKNAESPMLALAGDWRELLFPEGTDEEFADAYAQTVTFALLLGRSEGAAPLTLESAQAVLAAQHNLLSRALQVLTDHRVRREMAASLDLLLRVMAVVPPGPLAAPGDPWLYFYEDFLAAYDPELRKNAGVYYTPVQVVRAQVRLVDELLTERLGKPLGFADPEVVVLDPAVGTGTYLLGVIEHALRRIEAERGAGAVPGQAAELARNLHGFERLVGAYAVSELRVNRALRDRGAPPDSTAHIYLTDTLASPNAQPRQLPLFMQPISEQHEKALAVKREAQVIVCLGNPPYDRHEAATADNGDRTGAWVRWGDAGGGADAILRDFVEPVIAAKRGGQLKNLYNLYVYFWRWALWKLFEHDSAFMRAAGPSRTPAANSLMRGAGPSRTPAANSLMRGAGPSRTPAANSLMRGAGPSRTPAAGAGVASFISASSYLDGDAFLGMRTHMRRVCDEIWILDLGGEGHVSGRDDDNLFAIRTPVAIAVAVRANDPALDQPAKVHYAKLEGTRQGKLDALDAIDGFAAVRWRDCPDDWHAPFRPTAQGDYFGWPRLTDLMPWQHSGVQLKRTWPIAPDADTLERRWRQLLRHQGARRSQAFRETGDRTTAGSYGVALTDSGDPTPIASLPSDAPMPEVRRYAYRAFDRQHVIADSRLMSRPRTDLWRNHGESQLYLTGHLTSAMGGGPALVACAEIPDLHHFSGRGAKDAIPLYRAADASTANILPGLLEALSQAYNHPVATEDFLAYAYGALAHPGFAVRYQAELETRQLRLPLTKNAALFTELRAIGARLLFLHTYATRFRQNGWPHRIPPGAARCPKAVPGEADSYPDAFDYHSATRTLRVGEGEFAPVAAEIYEFQVSGFPVVRSWLRCRMKQGAGRKSSPLDDIRPERWTAVFTNELLDLLWVLEATVELQPQQARLLDAVVASDCFLADDLPPVPEALRKPPKPGAERTALL